jgi:hypothetical protein
MMVLHLDRLATYHVVARTIIIKEVGVMTVEVLSPPKTPIRRKDGVDSEPSKRLYTVRLYGKHSIKEGAVYRAALVP